jgi:hypothetical protein
MRVVSEGVSIMPQVVAAVLIGAGLAAGIKWLAQEVARAAQAARVAHDEFQRDETERAVTPPKDLGKLVWDAKAGVYRPANRRPV